MSDEKVSKKKRKLIFYCSVPIFDTWPKKMKLSEFQHHGFDVELWSTEEIFFNVKNIKAASSGSDEYLYDDLNILKIKSLIDLRKKVVDLDDRAIICIMTLGSNSNSYNYPDLEIFNKYKVKYVIHHLCPHFVVPNFWFKIKFNLVLFKKKLYNYKKKPSLIIGTGSEGRKQVRKIYRKNITYKSVPSFDILWLKEKPILSYKYIVYVEENVNLSPDASLFGTPNPVHDVKGFYERINNIFKKIEIWSNLKVIIAASGKYKYTSNSFNNRKIIYKKTSNLIQNSELVIGHKSLALQQAIVDSKILMILKDKGFSNLKNKLIHNFALSYKLNPIWTDVLTKSKFDKYFCVDISNNQKTINRYFREDGVHGSFLHNTVSAFHKI